MVEGLIRGAMQRIRASRGSSMLVGHYWPLNGHSFGSSLVLRGNAETCARQILSR